LNKEHKDYTDLLEDLHEQIKDKELSKVDKKRQSVEKLTEAEEIYDKEMKKLINILDIVLSYGQLCYKEQNELQRITNSYNFVYDGSPDPNAKRQFEFLIRNVNRTSLTKMYTDNDLSSILSKCKSKTNKNLS
jgi:hypothetical protein